MVRTARVCYPLLSEWRRYEKTPLQTIVYNRWASNSQQLQETDHCPNLVWEGLRIGHATFLCPLEIIFLGWLDSLKLFAKCATNKVFWIWEVLRRPWIHWILSVEHWNHCENGNIWISTCQCHISKPCSRASITVDFCYIFIPQASVFIYSLIYFCHDQNHCISAVCYAIAHVTD